MRDSMGDNSLPDRPERRQRRSACRWREWLACSAALISLGLSGGDQMLAGQNTTVALYSISVKFGPATALGTDGQPYNIFLDTGNPPLPYGEMAQGSPGWGADRLVGFYQMSTPAWPAPLYDDINLGLPAYADANSNGVDDFYEVTQAVPDLPAAGVFEGLSGLPGTVSAVWHREAGSIAGTCRLHLRQTSGSLILLDVRFTNAFELTEYHGTMRYQTGSQTATGNASMEQVGGPGGSLAATLQFARTGPDVLAVGPGTFTNANLQTLPFVGANALGRHGMNYVGVIAFNDGDLTTQRPDFRYWYLAVADPNDANQNGVPDLSDTPVPAAPTIALSRDVVGLQVRLLGAPGFTYVIEASTLVTPGSWSFAGSVTLTNVEGVVGIPPPSGICMVWRARF